ncbi:MAG: glycosyltransferase family 4 protein [Planctomycetia bacterium]|nr:glycosyltransferase family 4 protein [Planctomycetia bacterium]
MNQYPFFTCLFLLGRLFWWKLTGRSRRVVLLCSHDLSHSGAPKALLEMGQILRELGFIPVLLTPFDGPLRKLCGELGIPSYIFPNPIYTYQILSHGKRFYRFVVCNTVVLHYLTGPLERKGIPYCWWIHEAGYLPEILNDEMANDLRKSNHIYCVSKSSQEAISAFHPDTKLLHLGVSDQRNSDLMDRKCLGNSRMVFLYVGHFVHAKGQDQILEAWRQLSPKVSQTCELRFIGDDQTEYGVQMRRLAEGMDNVKFLGVLPHEEVLRQIAEADRVVLTSRGDSFPIAAMEALMFDKVLLISDRPELAAYVTTGKNGFVYPFDDRRQLVELLERLGTSSQLLPEGAARQLYETVFSKEVFRTNVREILVREGVLER